MTCTFTNYPPQDIVIVMEKDKLKQALQIVFNFQNPILKCNRFCFKEEKKNSQGSCLHPPKDKYNLPPPTCVA